MKPGDAVSDTYVGLTGRHNLTVHEDRAIQVRTNNQVTTILLVVLLVQVRHSSSVRASQFFLE